MRFDIRVELPFSELWDFKVNAEAQDNGGEKLTTPAFRLAREAANTMIAERVGPEPRIEWRGMVAFVNREIPLDKEHPLWPKARQESGRRQARYARVALEHR